MKPYVALIRNDVRLACRQKAVIFFNYLMPLGFFFLFAQANHAERGGSIVQVITMVLVIGILGNGLFGGGMRAVQERENNILRRYKVAPISPLPLLVASTVTGLLVYLPLVAITLILGHFQYGMDAPKDMVGLLIFIVLGLIAIRSIGLIIASVVNSVQESTILVQIAYMSMLFLSGATLPISMFPNWLRIVSRFIPATYIVSGLQNILIQNESLAANWPAVGALALTTATGLLLCVKLFRWEKEEKVKPSAKLWLIVVLIPFVALGVWQMNTTDDVRKSEIIDREFSHSRTYTCSATPHIFIGDGHVIENGAVLVKDGKIAEVYEGNMPNVPNLNPSKPPAKPSCQA